MGKVTQILAHVESDTIYFKCGEDTYVGFTYEFCQDDGTIQEAIEAINDGMQFFTSTTKEVEEHTGGNAEDITEDYIYI